MTPLAKDGIHDPENDAVSVLQPPYEAMKGFPRDARGIINWVQANTNRAAFEKIIAVDRPSELSSEELFRRLRAFEELRLNLNGTVYPVTRLCRSREKRSDPLDFDTSDGIRLRPCRFMHMPKAVYRLYQVLTGDRR